MRSTSTTTPRVWIGCLAAYTAGALHGEWVDATLGENHLREAAERVISTSPAWQLNGHAEEWFLADNEGFGGIIGEYESLASVATLAEAIEEHGDALIGWLANEPSDWRNRIEDFGDAYQGEHASLEDYARQYAADIGQFTASTYISDHADWDGRMRSALQAVFDSYIDWDAYTRDFEGDVFTAPASDGVYVYRRNV